MPRYSFLEDDVEAAPKIPMALSNYTIVNLLPYPLREWKTNMIPGYFQIPKAQGDKFGMLHVGSAICWQDSPFPDTPPIRLETSSRDMARSIVNDFLEGQLEVGPDTMPGVFYIEGHLSREEILHKHKDKLAEALARQRRWFAALVKFADDDWARYKQHQTISDIQRYAARELGLEREWMSLELDKIMDLCPFCRSQVRQDALVCSTCREVIKPDEYKKLHTMTVGLVSQQAQEAKGAVK